MEEQDLLAVTIGKNLTRLRKMANLTQLELAEKLNYSDKSVSKWEQGNGIPDVRILIQLADLYGVSLDDLVREQQQVKVMPKNAKRRQRLITVLLSSGLCWLVAVIVFVGIGIFAPDFTYGWVTFLYAVPATAIVVLVFSCIWHYKWVRIISISVLVWSLLACIYITFLKWNIWLIFLIGVPLQILALFFFVWRKRRISEIERVFAVRVPYGARFFKNERRKIWKKINGAENSASAIYSVGFSLRCASPA